MSGTVVAVYSRVLEPGQDILITEDVTVQITNITLEVDEKSTDTSRATLKMQHLQAHPALLQAVAGYDMSDSEDDDEFDSEDDEDEDDLDEDELADMSKLSKASAASTSSKKGVNGKAAEEEDDEEDDVDFDGEGDDEDEDSDEDEFDRQEAEVQICSLLPGKLEHFNTNIILPGGEDFVFRLTGTHKVHLFGHYLYQPVPPQLDEDQDPYGEDEYDSDEEIDSDDLDESEMDDDEEDADASARFMEIEDAPKKADKPASKPAAKEDSAAEPKLSKNQLKKLAKKEKEAATPAAATEKKAEPAKKPESKKEEPKTAPAAAATTAAKKAPSKKQTLPSGLVIEDNKVGTGAVAKSGQRVSMRYIGRLNNGKIFDQNTKGAPFSFKLGKGEVIKGWDEGIAGMQVGGERKLVIPAKLAYGKQGVEGIPPNSTLTFEVKLLSIK